MASPKMIILGCLVLLLAMVADATPPGIANNPAQATCKIKKYKMCYNLPHVCPKFCPDACEVECASCKPICSGSSAPYVPPPGDSSGGDTKSPPPTYVSPPSDGEKGKDDGEKGKDKGKKDSDTPSDDKKGNEDGEKGKDDGEKGKVKGKKDGDTPSDGSGSTPPYSPPPRPIVDPFPPPPPTYSPPTLPSSPPPPTPTPTYSPPTPTPSPPTTPPSSPSPLPKPPTLSPPTQTPPTPSPTPPTPSSSPPPYSPLPTPSPPTPVTPTPSSPPPPTPTPSPVTPTPSYSPPPPPTTPTPSPPTPPTPSVPWTPPSPPSTPTPTPPTPSVPWTPTPTLTPPTPSPPPSSPNPPPSTPWTPPQSPPYSDVASRKRVRCTKKEYGACYGQEFTCPANCPTSCQIDCNSCKPVCSCDYPGAVCQDPRFIGGDGITFYFHGKKDRDFCLVSDPNLHINAHFIGKRNSQMSRDFTWVQSLGILFDNHRLSISALKTATWDDSVDRLSLSLDDTPIALNPTTMTGLEWQSTTTPQVKITRISQFNNIILEIQDKITLTIRVTPISEEESRVHNYNITKEDCFAHLDLGFKFHSLSKEVDGVLGKTYRDDYISRVKMGVAMPVLGGDKEYSTSNLFATDCLASKFNINNIYDNNYNGDEEEASTLKNFGEFGSMNCNSGMNGEGVVCKR